MSALVHPCRTAILPVLLFFGAFMAAQSARSADPLRVGFQLSSTLTAILKANGQLEEGLARRGVTVTWHEFTSGLPQLEALNTGNIDFSADVADTVPIFALAAGAKLAYVAEEAPSPKAQGILVPAKSPIETVADLKGKKIAVTKGAGSHYLLIAALRSQGLGLQDTVPAYLTPSDARAAFVGGRVDAWVAWDPYLTTTERQDGARLLIDGEGLANYKRYYLASQRYASARGDVLKVVYDKLDATGQWVKSNPGDAAAILAPLWHIDRNIVEEVISHRSYRVGAVNKAGLFEQKKIAAAFFEQGLLPQLIDGSEAEIWRP
jgi:sulfonate transport system substrate-binding protein